MSHRPSGTHYPVVRPLLAAGLLALVLAGCSQTDATTTAQQTNEDGRVLGEFELIEVGGIPHLRDQDGFIVYPGFCPTACNALWEKDEPDDGDDAHSRIGAIRAQLSQAGEYQFEYSITPLLGEFVDLQQLEILVANDDATEMIDHYQYAAQDVITNPFSVEAAGTYLIGFGPSDGVALTEFEARGVQLGFDLRYRLTPETHTAITQSNLDLVVRESDGQPSDLRVVPYEELAVQGPELSQAVRQSLAGLIQSGIDEATAEQLVLRGVNNSLVGGVTLTYPLGRNASHVQTRLNELSQALDVLDDHEGVDAKRTLLAKLWLYLTTVAEQAPDAPASPPTEDDLQAALEPGGHQAFVQDAIEYLQSALPRAFPDLQDRQAFESLDPFLQATERIEGPTRIQTAIEISRSTAESATAAVLVRADEFPDGLTAASLARQVDGPILVNPVGQLHEDVAAELQRLGAEEVYLVGGTAALSSEVDQALRSLGIDTTRLAGENRFHTAELIAREVAELGGPVDQVILARGGVFADALSAGNLATWNRAPILLTPRQTLHPATERVLTDSDVVALRDAATQHVLGDGEAHRDVLIAGGTAAIGPAVESRVRDAGFSVERLAGPERYATAASIAEKTVRDTQAGLASLYVATGADFADALVAAPAAHAAGGTLTLIDGTDLAHSPATRDFISRLRSNIGQLRIVGGSGAIAPSVVDQMQTVLNER